MRIYRKVTVDIITGQTLFEDSYEYSGPVAECKGENKIFKQQQQQSFNQLGGTSQQMNDFYNTLMGQMGQRFGQQSQTFQTLSRSLTRTIRPGPGDYDAQDKVGDPNGGAGGGAGGGGGMGGRGRNRPPEGGDGGGLNLPDFASQAGKFGWDPSLYDPAKLGYDPQRFWGNEEAALRTESSELVADAYQDSSEAFGQRALQLGGFSDGLMASAAANMQAEQARAEASGQREVSMFGAQQLSEGMKYLAGLKAQLQADMAAGKISASQAAAQYKLGQDQIAAQERASKRAAGAARAGVSAALAQQDRHFAASLAQDRYFRGIGALSGLGGMQDPLGYGQLGFGGLSGMGGIWGNTYNTGSQGMVQTRSNPLWGQLLGGALGGLTGGLGSIFSSFGKGGMGAGAGAGAGWG